METEFKLNQKVWDRTVSKLPGIILEIDKISEYSITVYWKEKDYENNYTLEGKKYDDDDIATLKPYYYELVETEYLPEYGDLVYCWNDGDKKYRARFFLNKAVDVYKTSNYFPTDNECVVEAWDFISTTKPEL